MLLPSPAFAWGFTAHKYIMRRAIDLLPATIKPFFVAHRDEIVLRVTDPDLWRNVGWEDDPNHFVDFGDARAGAVPVYRRCQGSMAPRSRNSAPRRSSASARCRGAKPSSSATSGARSRDSPRAMPYTTSDTVLFAAVASHYIQDAHQPLHASNNYDGQLTGQRGLHSRFERDLVERYESRLTVNPAPPRSVASARDAAFDALLASHQLVAPMLAADKEAIGSKDAYDDVYFEAFFQKVKPMLEERLAAAITATASMIVSAWEQAGKPELKNADPRPVQKVQRGQQAR